MFEFPISIFIGYDSKEPIAYHVLSHSILRQATLPVMITPLAINTFSSFYSRKRSSMEATEFSFTRFLVPYLSLYEGYSVYMDCDMLCLTDIAKLFSNKLIDQSKAVWVCKHEYTPKTDQKFLGKVQTKYPRKNWSSFMVFNNDLCRTLTPKYVSSAEGLELHRFQWIQDQLIGQLPLEWNWLVGEYSKNNSAQILHYTIGGPWFEAYKDCDYAQEWFAERTLMLQPS